MSAMFVAPSMFSVIVRRIGASVLVLWLAGVGCIIGCEMNAAAAPAGDVEIAVEGESCDAASGHDCCEKADKNAPAGVGHPDTGTGDSCCPLIEVAADAARKVSSNESPLVAVGRRPPIAAYSPHSTSSFPFRLRVPDRGSTHLRCCVFLI